jgi:hypothetical protein
MGRSIGFSTGAVARGDFGLGLQLLRQEGVRAVELSALRDRELIPLLEAIGTLDLSFASYISFHAPGRFETIGEEEAAGLLRQLLPRRWPIIVHPDALRNPPVWQGFGEWLCIENMDRRKPTGRTEAELRALFREFPTASFCFDIGHARQVDATMEEAARMLRSFGSRLKQVHMSEVDPNGGHLPVSAEAVADFRKVAALIPSSVPIILETDVPEGEAGQQVALAEGCFVPTDE